MAIFSHHSRASKIIATPIIQRLMFRALVFRQSDWRSCRLCVGLYADNGATLLVGIW